MQKSSSQATMRRIVVIGFHRSEEQKAVAVTYGNVHLNKCAQLKRCLRKCVCLCNVLKSKIKLKIVVENLLLFFYFIARS